MASHDEIVTKTREFLFENLLFLRPDLELGNDTPLLKAGVVDSMGVVEIVEYVQDAFSITVGDEEITEDHLGTLDAIATFVLRKIESGAGDSLAP